MNEASNVAMTESTFDYMAEANVTCSNNYHGDKVPAHYFDEVMKKAIAAIEQLDGIKKTLFYGRDCGITPAHPMTANSIGLPHRIDADNPARGEVILHAIVGKVTEAGELLELLRNVLFEGKTFDEVNFIEEIGDGFWYDAIGLNAIRCTFGEAQRINIAKLRRRFPDKFNEFDANNRDLFAERQILEKRATAKPECRIENWIHVGNVLIGDVIGHPRLGDEKDCRTSFIVRMDEANGICETRNTIYRLGEPYRAVPRSISGLSPAVDTGD